MPTWRGWIVLLLLLGVAGMVVLRGIYGFLAVNEPVRNGILVVEGWSPDYVTFGAVEEYRCDGYKMICVTGGPIEFGNALREYRTYAECGRAVLLKAGVSEDAMHAVPADPVERDRTFASAVALKRWIGQSGTVERRVNIMGNGPHARRTRLLYEKALGPEFQVGIFNVEERTFNPKEWWKTSQGFRAVADEAIAYAYARFAFFPAKPR